MRAIAQPILGAVLLSSLAAAALTGAPSQPSHATTAEQAPAPGPSTDLTARDLVMAGKNCGMERWSVKTASDADRNLVSTNQHQTTIAALRSLARPGSLPPDGRAQPVEIREYVIAGTLTEYKLENDGDVHLVITDPAGSTLIAELADPSCVTAARFKPEITNVRRTFLARYTPTGSYQRTQRAIRVRGIGFFDRLHGQTGVAPNGIELHPVLGLGFP
jgi:hypothetical protein